MKKKTVTAEAHKKTLKEKNELKANLANADKKIVELLGKLDERTEHIANLTQENTDLKTQAVINPPVQLTQVYEERRKDQGRYHAPGFLTLNGELFPSGNVPFGTGSKIVIEAEVEKIEADSLINVRFQPLTVSVKQP